MTALPEYRERPVAGSVPILVLEAWKERHGVVAGITGRGEGFNLGLLTADRAERVTGNWRRLAAHFGGFRTLALGLQTHETRVAVHRDPAPGWMILDGVDGHVTRAPGVLLTVTVADCVPIYLLHPPTRTVGLLHAGWRGVAGGMVERGIACLLELASAAPAELVIHCGVSICGPCYNVGSEVQLAVTGRAAPEGPLDLRQSLRERAAAAGVGAVSVSPWCAAHDDGLFFSHRRSGGRDGRMVAYLGVPPA